MKLIYYIFASILSHLLLIGSLYFVHSEMDIKPSVFNVDIVTPRQEDILRPPETIIPPVANKKPLLTKHRRKPPEEEQLPKTLYGDGTDVSGEDLGQANGLEDRDKVKDQRAGDAEDDIRASVPGKDKGKSPDEDSLSEDPRTFLFDKKTIDKFARKGAPPKKGLTFDTSGFQHRGYMRMLKERIEDIWKYPKEAAQKGLSGDLYLKFSIKKDGKLGEVELLRTSGHRTLDEAAMKALKNAEPFWPLPEDWDKDVLEIKGHFIYVFGDVLVM